MNKTLLNILSVMSLTDKKDTTNSILQIYKEKGNCVVHFLYFANIILNKLHKEDPGSEKKERFIQALLGGDFLLPDGIALNLLYKKHFKRGLPNLNGTDFLPYFLRHLPEGKKVEIFIYAGIDEVVQKSSTYITATFGHPVIFAQNGFKEFDWSKVDTREDGVIRVLLVGRGSPLQETWTEQNREQIEKSGLLVFTVGGLLDFWSGTEKRAPLWMRRMKIEWLYRALSNPKKNLRKTLVSLQLLKFLL